jgi:Helix-turn-helix domain
MAGGWWLASERDGRWAAGEGRVPAQRPDGRWRYGLTGGPPPGWLGYKTLVGEVRASLAEAMLSSAGLSVEDAAIGLGYAESASFIHAYRRWNGVTPSAHRRQLIARHPPR